MKQLRKPTKARQRLGLKHRKKILIHPIYGIVDKQLKCSKYFIIHSWKRHIEKDTNTLNINLICVVIKQINMKEKRWESKQNIIKSTIILKQGHG